MEPILKFDRVSKHYPNGVHALKEVSLEVTEGEFISVIGPSGSGKSTLLRAINRLIPISGGTVWLDGQTVSNQHGKGLREQRRKVGMIFQNYNLVYSLSVLQNVLHGRLGYMNGFQGVFGLYREKDKREALDLLKELGLEQFSYNRGFRFVRRTETKSRNCPGNYAESKTAAVRRTHRVFGPLQCQNDYGITAGYDPKKEYCLYCQSSSAGCSFKIFYPYHWLIQGRNCF